MAVKACVRCLRKLCLGMNLESERDNVGPVAHKQQRSIAQPPCYLLTFRQVKRKELQLSCDRSGLFSVRGTQCVHRRNRFYLDGKSISKRSCMNSCDKLCFDIERQII